MKKLFFTALIKLLAISAMFAQQVTGVIVDEATQEPLPGVNVLQKGTTRGSISNLDGQYTIEVSGPDAVLVFSFVGYLDEEETVGDRTTIDVILSEDVVGLDEVVVVGYGTQKKTSLTAAVGTVDPEEMKTSNVPNTSNALVGRVPGLITVQSGGEVGGDQADIYIRGIGTTGNKSPLIIVDGIPRGNWNELDVTTIESFTVLKDAAAVAPYGMAGANGVILITTKSGRSGKTLFNYNGSMGFQNLATPTEYADAYQYAYAIHQAQNMDGLAPDDPNRIFTTEDVEIYREIVNGSDAYDPNLYTNTDYYDYLVTPNAPITRHNLDVSGGNELITYYTGVNYLYQEDLWPSSNRNKYGMIAKIDITPTSKTKIGVSLNGWLDKMRNPSLDSPLDYLNTESPTDPVYYTDPATGEKLLTSGSLHNAIIPDLISLGSRATDNNVVMTQLYLEQEILTGLSVKGVFSYDRTTLFTKNWSEPGSDYYKINLSTTPYTFDLFPNSSKHSLNQSQRTSEAFTYQGIVRYTKSFGNNNLSVLGVAEARDSRVNTFSAGRSQYELPIDELDFGSADKDYQSNSGSSSETAQVGFVYRINYDFAGKYLFETTGRYDGHYYFAPGKKFGFFPAVAIGWRISEESFMSGMGSLDNLKIRASAGQSGNLAGGPNQYSSGLSLYGNSFPLGGVTTMGVKPGREGNPDITWEKATKYNVGLEFSLWNRLIAGEVDYFFEKRNNMLLSPGSSVPVEYGIALAQINAGEMQNQGIDFNLNSRKAFSNGLRVGLDFNFTFARNKMLEIFENEVTANDPNRTRTGRPLGAFFGLEAIGLFQESDDVNGDGVIDAADGLPEQLLGGTVRPGNIRYKDINGDGVIDGTDETHIGYNEVPEIIYSIIPSVSWKGFDFNMMLQGAGNTDLRLGETLTNAIGINLNVLADKAMDSWTPENPDAKWNRLTTLGTTANDASFNSWYLINAAYLRLKHVELGYTIPENLISFASLRVYFSGTNLLTWSEPQRRGLFDAEVDDSSYSQAGRGNYHPQMKTFSFGVNLSF